MKSFEYNTRMQCDVQSKPTELLQPENIENEKEVECSMGSFYTQRF